MARESGKGKRKTFLMFWIMIMALLLTGIRVSAFSPAPGTEEPKEPPQEETMVEVRFISKTGNVYSDLTVQVPMGKSLTLPAVPGYEGKKNSGWKLGTDVPETEGFVFGEGDVLTLSEDDSLVDYVEGGVLCFYAVEPYSLTLWNNSGTGKFQQLYVFPGSEVTLPDFPNSNYRNYGWTDTVKGTEAKYGIGAVYKVSKDTDLYIVRYHVSKFKTVTFYNSTGGTNKSFQVLGTEVLQNQKLKLPEVPPLAGYTNLGWSTRKNAAKITYSAGQLITVKKDLALYAVRKKLPVYKVTFNNNAGTSTAKAYTALNKNAYKGKVLNLPSPPAVKGYKALGWTTVRKGKTIKYKAGAQITVNRNLNFYAVYQKIVYRTVSFYNSNGASGKVFSALNKKVASGSSVTIPDPPAKNGYVALGWSSVKNSVSAVYTAGAKLKVSKNISLYAVYKTSVTVTLYKNDGTVYQTLKVGKGEFFTFPAIQNTPPYTMMGWDDSPGKTTNPKYEVGEPLRITAGKKFYAVVFDRNAEPDYTADSLPLFDRSKYGRVIFVGDSRTRRMFATLSLLGSDALLDHVSYVAEDGKQLGWLKLEGYNRLLSELETGGDLPAAVIFNMGINDLLDNANYISYMQEIAPELMRRGCRLFYMSLNPINSENLRAAGKTKRNEQMVRTFNSMVQSLLCTGVSAPYTYIDTYTYLLKNGYGMDNSYTGVDTGVDDGLHFTEKTYKRIYKYCIDFINRS